MIFKGAVFDFSSGGDILPETEASGNTLNEYIFFGGKRIAMLPAGGNPIYYAEDLLGSSRVITQNNGAVCYDADFDPFGGEHPYTNTCSQNFKFSGKERDAKSGLDNFGARYYTNRFGRWLSADWSSVPVPVPYANLAISQTLNLYAYVTNNPVTGIDPDGHAGMSQLVPFLQSSSEQDSFDYVSDEEVACLAQVCARWSLLRAARFLRPRSREVCYIFAHETYFLDPWGHFVRARHCRARASELRLSQT